MAGVELSILRSQSWYLPRSDRALRAAGVALKSHGRPSQRSTQDRCACLVRTAALVSRAGQLSRSLAHLREALRLDPDRILSLRIADLFLELGKPSESHGVLESRLATSLNDPTEAPVENPTKAPVENPTETSLDRKILLLRSRLHVAFGRWEAGLEAAEQLIESKASSERPWDPKILAHAHLIYGHCALNLRARTKAHRALHLGYGLAHASRLSFVEQETTALLGQHFSSSGQPDSAVQAFLLSLSAHDSAPRDEIQEPESSGRTQAARSALEAVGEAWRRNYREDSTLELARRVERLLRLVEARRRLTGELSVLRASLSEKIFLRQRVLEADVSRQREWLRRKRQREGQLVTRSASASEFAPLSAGFEPNPALDPPSDLLPVEKAMGRLFQAEEELQRFRTHAASQDPAYSILSGIPVDDERIDHEDTEPSHGIVLSYFTGPDRSCLMAWRDRRLHSVVSLPRQEMLEKWIGQANPTDENPCSDVAHASASELLSRTLLGEILKEIEPGDPITLVEDGPLEKVCFESLPHPNPPSTGAAPTLGQSHPFRYALAPLGLFAHPPLLSGSPSPPSKDRGPHEISALFLTDPDYSEPFEKESAFGEDLFPEQDLPLRSTDLSWGLLPPHTTGAEEAETLRTRFSGSVLKTGAEASATTLRELAPKCGLIHLCVCGVDDAIDSTRSGLALSQSDLQSDGYFLRGEILSLRLRSPLVVLSRHRQGVSRRPDEVRRWSFRVAHGFLLAGAQAVVAPFFDLPPKENTQVLSQLYDRLAKGTDPAVALREIRSENPSLPVPYSVFT